MKEVMDECQTRSSPTYTSYYFSTIYISIYSQPIYVDMSNTVIVKSVETHTFT